MATPVYKGETDFRLMEAYPARNIEGFDTLQLVFEGRDTAAAAFELAWKPGTAATQTLIDETGFSYPNMYVRTSRMARAGRFARATVELTGFLDSWRSRNVTAYRTTSDVILQTATVGTTDDESVQVAYYGDVTTALWISVTSRPPSKPIFPMPAGSDIPIGLIIDASPANFTGTLEYRTLNRLSQFLRDEIAPGVWGVTESWERRLEATTSGAGGGGGE